MAYDASSDIITNLDASPLVRERTKESDGRVYTTVAEFTSTVFDALTAGQTAAIARVPADARLIGVFATNEAAATGSYDVGLYRSTPHDSANTVIDADGLADAVDMNVATQHSVLGTAALASSPWLPGNKNKTLREVFTSIATGDATVDVVVTIQTVMGTAKAIAFEVQYTV